MKSNRYYTNKNGYRQHYNPGSPESRKSGFSPVHRDVARKKYNRDIKRGEVVHHKDGNKLNNSWDNIEIMSRSDHSKLHSSQRNQTSAAGCASVIATIAIVTLLVFLLFL